MTEDIARRIAKGLGVPELPDLLADNLIGSDLHSLLLSVLKRRISKMEPQNLMAVSPVTKICDLDARMLNRLEGTAYQTASNFEAIELSPLHPLGAVTILTGLDQSNVLSTIRAFECASDPTIGLALECARRRKSASDRKNISRLCTNHRVVRFPLPQNPAFTSHFKLFSLVSAGRDLGSFAYETQELREHIECYLSLVNDLRKDGFQFQDIVVEISDTRLVSHLCSVFKIDRELIRSSVRARDSASAAKLLEQHEATWPKTLAEPLMESLDEFNPPKHLMHQLTLLEQQVLAPLKTLHPDVQIEFNLHRLTGLGYYEGPCFHIKMKNDRAQPFMLADGGFVDWTQLLLSDSKERLMTSAIGTELLCRMFRKTL